ncbi:MAG: ABC transporter permease [Microbacterium sp.]
MTIAMAGTFGASHRRFARLLRVELRKVAATRGTQWVLGVLVGTWVLAALGVAAVTLGGGGGQVNVIGALMGMSAFVIMLAPILGIMIMAGDWQSRDVVTLFTAEPRRRFVFWAKVGAAVIAGAAIIVSALALAILASAALAGIAGASLQWSLEGVNIWGMLLGAVVAIASGVAYGAAIPRVAIAVTFSLLQGLAIDPLLALDASGVGKWFRLSAISEIGGASGAVGPALVAGILFVAAPLTAGYFRTLRADIR